MKISRIIIWAIGLGVLAALTQPMWTLWLITALLIGVGK